MSAAGPNASLKDAVRSQMIAARVAAGLTQTALAARLGLTSSSISRMEAGHQGLDLDAVAAWGEACGHRVEVRITNANGDQPLDNPTVRAFARLPEDRRALIVSIMRQWAGGLIDSPTSDDERSAILRRLGVAVAGMRTAAGLTQAAMAARLGCALSTVSRAEAAVRGLDVADLVDWARTCSGRVLLTINEDVVIEHSPFLSDYARLSPADAQRIDDLVARMAEGGGAP